MKRDWWRLAALVIYTSSAGVLVVQILRGLL